MAASWTPATWCHASSPLKDGPSVARRSAGPTADENVSRAPPSGPRPSSQLLLDRSSHRAIRVPALKSRSAIHAEIVNPPEPAPTASGESTKPAPPIAFWSPSIRQKPKSASALKTLAVWPCAHRQTSADEFPRTSKPRAIPPAIKATSMTFPKTLIRHSFPSPTSDDLCHGYRIIRLYSN